MRVRVSIAVQTTFWLALTLVPGYYHMFIGDKVDDQMESFWSLQSEQGKVNSKEK